MGSHNTKRQDERKRMENRLALAVVLFVVVIGSAAIGLAYGLQALWLGSTCLIVGAILFALLWGILTLIERWTDA